MNPHKRMFLIDGMAQIYRAHFAMIKNPLLTKDGRHTSAIYGFMNYLFKLIREEKPDYLAIVLDSKEKTFRHELYTDYKATREKMPDELVEQLEPLYEVISHTKIPMLKKVGFEADDIMGTLAKKANKAGLVTYLVTADKDMMQLVNDKTFMYSPGNSFRPTIIYDEEKVKEKWGVGPNKIINMLALVGDTSDNVPGIDGVGPKTALKLLNEYETIESIIENAHNVRNKRVKEGLMNGKDLVHLSRELVTIDCEVPIEFHLEELSRTEMNFDDLKDAFQKLEMHSLISQMKSLNGEKEKVKENIKKQYKIIRSIDDLDELVAELLEANLIAFDLETTSVKALEADIVGFSFSISDHSAYYVPIDFPERNNDDMDLSIVLDKIKILFENSSSFFCGQNIKYDALVLSKYGIELNNIAFDTMVAEYLLHPEKHSYKLDYLSLDYLNYKMRPIEDLIGSGLHQISMSKVPLKDVSFYANEDSDITFQLSNVLMEKIKEEKLDLPYNEIELPLIPVLIEIEKNGIYLNMDYLKELSIDFGNDLNSLTKSIYQIVGKEFNINSPKQLSEVLFDEIGLKQIKKRSTAVEVLEVLKKYHPLPEVILEYRHLSKLKSTYVDAFPNYVNENTGRIHTSLNQTITSTGRLSSTSPNFQNIPIRTEKGKKLRKAFVSQNKDHVILSADYSQVELRIMAHYSKEPELIKAFKADEDIHSQTAALVNKIPISSVTVEQRRAAKVVNFGIMYGAGPYRMSQELGINMAEAKSLIDNYFKTYPGIKKYMSDTIEKARKVGFVETLYNRKRMTFNLNANNGNVVRAEERAAINMPIQGTAADLIKIAMISIYKNIKKNHYKSKMILQIHDELLFECPKAEVDDFANMVQNEMENAIELLVPLKVDWNYGDSWYDAH